MKTSIFIESIFSYTTAQLLHLTSKEVTQKLTSLIDSINNPNIAEEIWVSLINPETVNKIEELSPILIPGETKSRLTPEQETATRLLTIIRRSFYYIPVMIALSNCNDINERLSKTYLLRLFNLLSQLRNMIYQFHQELLSLIELTFDKNMKSSIVEIRKKLYLSASLIKVHEIQKNVMRWHNAKTGMFEFNCKLDADVETQLDTLILSEATLIDTWKNQTTPIIFDYLQALYKRVYHSDNLPLFLITSLRLLAYMPNKTPYINTLLESEPSKSQAIKKNICQLAKVVGLSRKKLSINISIPELDFSSDYFKTNIDSLHDIHPYIESLLVMLAYFHWIAQSPELNPHLRFNNESASTLVLVLLIQLALVMQHAQLLIIDINEEVTRISALTSPSTEESVRKFKLEQELLLAPEIEKRSTQLPLLNTSALETLTFESTSILRLFLILMQQPSKENQVFCQHTPAGEICLVKLKCDEALIPFTVAAHSAITLRLIDATHNHSITAVSSALKKLFHRLSQSPEAIRKLWQNNTPYNDILHERLRQYQEAEYIVGREITEDSDRETTKDSDREIPVRFYAQPNSRNGKPLLKITELSKLLSGLLHTQVAVAKGQYTQALATYQEIQPPRELTIPNPGDLLQGNAPWTGDAFTNLITMNEEMLQTACEQAFVDMTLSLTYQHYAQNTQSIKKLMRAESKAANKISEQQRIIAQLTESASDENKQTLIAARQAMLDARAEIVHIRACLQQKYLSGTAIATPLGQNLDTDVTRVEALSTKYRTLMQQVVNLSEQQQKSSDSTSIMRIFEEIREINREINSVRVELTQLYLKDLARSRQGYASLMMTDRLYMQRECLDPYRDDSAEIIGMTLPLLVEVTQCAFAEALARYHQLQIRIHTYQTEQIKQGKTPDNINTNHIKLSGHTIEEHERLVILAAQDYKNTLTRFGKDYVAHLIPHYPNSPPSCLQLLVGLYVAAQNTLLDSPTYAKACAWAERRLPAVGAEVSLRNQSALYGSSQAAASVTVTPERGVSLPAGPDSEPQVIANAYKDLLKTLSEHGNISRFDPSVKEGLLRLTQVYGTTMPLTEASLQSSLISSSSSSAPFIYQDESLPWDETALTWLARINQLSFAEASLTHSPQ